jgi:hypothetical protein
MQTLKDRFQKMPTLAESLPRWRGTDAGRS